jgi:hypothetical protein
MIKTVINLILIFVTQRVGSAHVKNESTYLFVYYVYNFMLLTVVTNVKFPIVSKAAVVTY